VPAVDRQLMANRKIASKLTALRHITVNGKTTLKRQVNDGKKF